MTLTVPHLHASGRWDRRESLLKADLDRWLRLNPHVTVVTLTEAGDSSRGHALERPGWERVQGAAGAGTDECALGLLHDEWRVVYRASEPVSGMTYLRRNKKRSPRFFALVVVLEHRATGTRVLFSVLHSPSAVETPNGWARSARPTVYRDVIRGWKAVTLKAARANKVNARVLSADLNLNLHKPWVRGYLRGVFPGLASTWDGLLTRVGGTLGKRLIDSSLVSHRVHVDTARILPQSPSGDHRAFIERLTITPPGKGRR